MYWKKGYFVLNCELYGTIWSIYNLDKNCKYCTKKKMKWVMYILYKSMEGVINTKKSKKG